MTTTGHLMYCKQIALAAALLLAGTLGIDRAEAAIISYQYTGVSSANSISAAINALSGLPVTATFTVDTSVPTTSTFGIHQYTDFNVLDAVITIGSATFYSKPFAQFDTNAPATTTNANRTTFSQFAEGDQISFSTYSNTTVGSVEGRGMMLRFRDDLTDALILGQYPADLSSFDFGNTKDLAQISLGVFAGSTSSTVLSTWGTVSVVPEPTSLLLLASGGLLLGVRHRR